MKFKNLSALLCAVIFISFQIQETVGFLDIFAGLGKLGFGIGKMVEKNNKNIKNRAGFVRSLINSEMYKSKTPYNVMVFNLRHKYKANLHGIKSYTEHVFPGDGTKFGVWRFERGTFENQRNKRGWNNWGFMGRYDRNWRGNKVFFKKR